MTADMDPLELRDLIASGRPPVIVDVRSRAEYSAGHIPGAIHMPFWAVLLRAGALRASANDSIVVYCGHGPRAQMARAAFGRRGFTRVACLSGHWSRWRQAGLPSSRSQA